MTEASSMPPPPGRRSDPGGSPTSPGFPGRGRLLRSWSVIIVGDVLSKLCSLASVALIARELSVGEFGAYSFGIAYGGFFVFFADLGLDAVTTRELVARPGEEARILGSALAATGALVLCSAVVAVAGLLVFESGLRVAGLISLAGMVAAVPGTIGLLLTARVRVLGATLSRLVGAVGVLVGTVLVLRAGGGPVAVLSVLSVSTVMVGVVLALLARRSLDAPITYDPATARRIVRGAAPVALAILGMVVFRRVDQLLLAHLTDVGELAHYAAAVRLIDALNIIPLAVATVALPVLSHLEVSSDGSTARSAMVSATGFRFLAAVVFPLAALGTFAGGTLLARVYGPAYATAGSALAVLLWAHFFGFTGVLVDQVLIARGQSRYLAKLTIAAAALSVALDLIVIPRWGGLGAAWVSLVAYSTPFVGGLLFPTVRDVFITCLRASLRPLAAGVAILLVLLALRPSTTLLLPTFVLASAGSLLATRSTSMRELLDLLRAARGRAADDALAQGASLP